jgi:hypothetical protein
MVRASTSILLLFGDPSRAYPKSVSQRAQSGGPARLALAGREAVRNRTPECPRLLGALAVTNGIVRVPLERDMRKDSHHPHVEHIVQEQVRPPQDIADAVFFDIRYGLRFKVGARSRPATDQEIDLVARTIVERLQQANWVIERGSPAPLGATPSSHGPKRK